MVLIRQAAADNTVVSEMGEQWSPNVAPPRTAAIVCVMISFLELPEAKSASGNACACDECR